MIQSSMDWSSLFSCYLGLFRIHIIPVSDKWFPADSIPRATLEWTEPIWKVKACSLPHYQNHYLPEISAKKKKSNTVITESVLELSSPFNRMLSNIYCVKRPRLLLLFLEWIRCWCIVDHHLPTFCPKSHYDFLTMPTPIYTPRQGKIL